MRLVWHSAAFCGTPLTIGFSSASALTSCAWIFSKTDEEEKEDEHVNMGKQSMVCHGANKAHAIGREQVGADVRRCLENTNSVFADRNVSLHPWAFYGNKLCLEKHIMHKRQVHDRQQAQRDDKRRTLAHTY